MNGSEKRPVVNAWHHVINTWKMLRITYGLLGIAAGADKFFNFITQWSKYVSPYIVHNLPISLTHFLYGVGILEIVVGILIFTKYIKIGAYAMGIWLLVVAVNLLSMGIYFDIAVRDIVMAIGVFALACLTDAVCECKKVPQSAQRVSSQSYR